MVVIAEAVERIGYMAEVTTSRYGLAARVDTESEAEAVASKLNQLTLDGAYVVTVQEMRDHYTIIFERENNRLL